MDAFCRCCLAVNSSLRPLSDILPDILGKKLTILEVLGIVTSCEVIVSNSLPCNICPACVKLIKKSFNFITMYKESQMKLLNILTKTVETKSGDIEDDLSSDLTKNVETISKDIEDNLSSDEEALEQIIIIHEDADATNDNINEQEKLYDSEEDQVIVISDDEEFEPEFGHSVKENIILMGIDDVLSDEDDVLQDSRKKNGFHEKRSSTRNTSVYPTEKIKIKEEIEEDEITSATCNICSKAFFSKKQLICHKRKVHKTNWHDKFPVLSHHLGKHKGRHFECYLCGCKYTSRKNLVFHIETRHQKKQQHKGKVHKTNGNENFQCKERGLRCRTEPSLLHHLGQHKHKSRHFECYLCGSKYAAKKNLVFHIETTHQKKQLICHKRKVPNRNSDEKFQCKECGARCRSEPALLHHLGKHKGIHFECYLCGCKYAAKKNLVFHIETTHQNLCRIRGKYFERNSTLKDRKKTHINTGQHKCIYCSFTTMTLGGLESHERNHGEKRPYKCQYCHKKFASIDKRTEHENSHNDIRKYKCQYCPKKYVRVNNLQVHQLSHDGSFVCHICGKSFPEAPILRLHFKLSHSFSRIK